MEREIHKGNSFRNAVMQEVIPQGDGEMHVCLVFLFKCVWEGERKKEQHVITCQVNVRRLCSPQGGVEMQL